MSDKMTIDKQDIGFILLSCIIC